MESQMTRNRQNGEIQIAGFPPTRVNYLSPPCRLARRDKQNFLFLMLANQVMEDRDD